MVVVLHLFFLKVNPILLVFVCFSCLCVLYMHGGDIYIYLGFEIVHYIYQHIPCIVVIVDCTHVNNCFILHTCHAHHIKSEVIRQFFLHKLSDD